MTVPAIWSDPVEESTSQQGHISSEHLTHSPLLASQVPPLSLPEEKLLVPHSSPLADPANVGENSSGNLVSLNTVACNPNQLTIVPCHATCSPSPLSLTRPVTTSVHQHSSNISLETITFDNTQPISPKNTLTINTTFSSSEDDDSVLETPIIVPLCTPQASSSLSSPSSPMTQSLFFQDDLLLVPSHFVPVDSDSIHSYSDLNYDQYGTSMYATITITQHFDVETQATESSVDTWQLSHCDDDDGGDGDSDIENNHEIPHPLPRAPVLKPCTIQDITQNHQQNDFSLDMAPPPLLLEANYTHSKFH